MNNSQQMQAKLESLPIGFDKMRVLAGGLSVTVFCLSRSAADKWALALAEVFGNSKARLVSGSWNAVLNKNTAQNPSKKNGYIVSIVA